jgi:hypothetical protein
LQTAQLSLPACCELDANGRHALPRLHATVIDS